MASIDRLPSGRWRARVSVKKDGKWKQVSFVADTKREAERQAANYEGIPDGTIGEMMEAYIDAKTAALSPSTVRAYKSVTNALKTKHGELWRVRELSPLEAQTLANEYKPKTARNVIGLIRAAVRFHGFSFPQVSFPRWELRSDFIPSEKDAETIVSTFAGTQMEIPVALGMMGLRRSEIAAVTPSDLTGDVLHVHAAKVYGPDGELHQKATKTARSDRYIQVPHALAKKIQKNGLPDLTPQAIGEAFRKKMKKLGLSVRFHDLRHYFVSYCHNVLGLSDAQIQTLGGWSSGHVMHRHYLHSMRDADAAKAVADAFSHKFSHRKRKKA